MGSVMRDEKVMSPERRVPGGMAWQHLGLVFSLQNGPSSWEAVDKGSSARTRHTLSAAVS
jgi:hypothetical protein